MTDSSESPSLEPIRVEVKEDRATILKREKEYLLRIVGIIMRDAGALDEARIALNRICLTPGRDAIKPITKQAGMIVDIEFENKTKEVYTKLRKVYEIDLELAMLSSRHLNPDKK